MGTDDSAGRRYITVSVSQTLFGNPFSGSKTLCLEIHNVKTPVIFWFPNSVWESMKGRSSAFRDADHQYSQPENEKNSGSHAPAQCH
ncbi:MAG: hypothetical protein KAI83_00685 [Thiomargarita sp.]|nr:hypothetical protein [Thiomargarita sp.]